MKQKITIMKKQLDLSDEEINRYMDFDTLRKKQKELDIRRRNRYTILKWSAPALLLIAVGIWFFTFKNNDLKVSNSEHRIESDQNSSIRPAQDRVLVADSVKFENRNIVIKEQIVKSSMEQVPDKKEIPKPIKNTTTESIYIQAEPFEGYASMYTYLNTHLQYPLESLKDSIQGVQTISFVINVDGKPEKIQFVESLGVPFENESRRLIESMPSWKPATLNGKPIASKLVLPLTFQIQKIKVKE